MKIKVEWVSFRSKKKLIKQVTMSDPWIFYCELLINDSFVTDKRSALLLRVSPIH